MHKSFNSLLKTLLFYFQVRYYLEFLRKNCFSREDWMIAVNSHVIGETLFNYCKSLTVEEINVEPVPQIIFDQYRGCGNLRETHFRSYRSAIFKVLDDERYLIQFDENPAKNV